MSNTDNIKVEINAVFVVNGCDDLNDASDKILDTLGKQGIILAPDEKAEMRSVG